MNTLIIDITKEINRWRLSAYESREGLEHRHYSIRQIPADDLNTCSENIFRLLDHASRDNETSENTLLNLRQNSQAIYNLIFPDDIKETLHDTKARHLVFSIDEDLIHIPWELLHDGESYVCLRFSVGRIIKTHHRLHHTTHTPEFKSPLRMLGLCDPMNQLSHARKAGILIRNELDRASERIQMTLKSKDIDIEFVTTHLHNYDILHFSGQAEYDAAKDGKSGWIFKNNHLTSQTIKNASKTGALPSIIFANAAQVGDPKTHRLDIHHGGGGFGLADAFLRSGVKHYIGTFARNMDNAHNIFAKEFYHGLGENMAIGESLRLARLKLYRRYGEAHMIWASYILYGDPSTCLHVSPNKHQALPTLHSWKHELIKYIGVTFAIGLTVILYLLLKDPPQPIEHPLKHVYHVKDIGQINYAPWYTERIHNLALHKNALASGEEEERFAAHNATDGNVHTRWSSLLADNQSIFVDLGTIQPIGLICILWEDAFAKSYKVQVSNDSAKWDTVYTTKYGDGKIDLIDLDHKKISARYVRIYGKKRATEWGFSLWEFEIYAPLKPNVALNKPTAMSSKGIGDYGSHNAFDGDITTRWGSEFSDPQWIQVDLEESYTIDLIDLKWDKAFATSFVILASDNGENWYPIFTISDNTHMEHSIAFEKPITTRYIRLQGSKRATEWGYSLWEIIVRGVRSRGP